MNLASAVTRAVIKQVDLPESVIRWVYNFVRIESNNGYQAYKPYFDSITDEYWEESDKLDKEEEKEVKAYNKKSREARANSDYDPDDVYDRKRKILERGLENRKARVPNSPEKQLIPYTMLLLSVFESIPPLKDRYTGTITTTLRDLLPENPKLNYNISPRHTELISWMELPDHFLDHEVDIDIPSRFEHTHIVGASGAGKTVLLKHMIFKDTKENASVVVMAPKGDLIPFLLSCPIQKERILLIRPQDDIALNLFDIDTDNHERSIEMLNFVLGSIFDVDTTGKQDSLLSACLDLCLVIPGATVQTLRDILRGKGELPPEFVKHLHLLDQDDQDFFKHDFPHRDYNNTKFELQYRLRLLLKNKMIKRIFTQPRTDFRIADEIEKGKVILIDTAIDKWSETYSSFFGRFFIGLMKMASERRKSDIPVYFYIDEAGDYLDANVRTILEKAREARVGITLAHQELSQLGDIAPAVFTNTSTKMVGGVSRDDALKLGKETGVDPDVLAEQRTFEFTVKCRGVNALKTHYPPKYINTLPKRDVEQFYNAPAVEYPVDDTPELQLVAEKEEKYDVPHDGIEDWHKP